MYKNFVAPPSTPVGSVMELPDFKGRPSGFHFKLAQDDVTRQAAYRLSHSVYSSKGYNGSNRTEPLVVPCEARPDTHVLTVCTARDQVVATATVIFDRASGLPGDSLFSDTIVPLRTQGRSMLEIVRLAVAPAYQGKLLITTRLLNWAFHCSLIERGCDDLLAEVNPRHVGFYTRLLCFDVLAKARPCLRVAGAPAVLLRLRRSVYERQVLGLISEVGGKELALHHGLFARFLPVELWGREGRFACSAPRTVVDSVMARC